MTKEQAEYFYGSIEAYYGISVIGSIFYGVLGFVFQIYIHGFDNILEKAGYSFIITATIFLLATYDVTFDILKNDKKKDLDMEINVGDKVKIIIIKEDKI